MGDKVTVRITRRNFMASILAAGIAPAYVRYGSLMVPSTRIVMAPEGILAESVFVGDTLNYVYQWQESATGSEWAVSSAA